ncbi:hypothetical protein KIW84_070372 [Lathyrus oleraceus]|uniref:Uncharacterized protein n=1 Tax=Pisum sativum TaxID=3888 RepID=A0A9D4VGM8_PEA|nr:hypothetical protein KIW84_070372 [Pisum sativum]
MGDFEITFDDIDNLGITTDTHGCILPDAWNPNTNGIPLSPMISGCIDGGENFSLANIDSPGTSASVVYESVSADDNLIDVNFWSIPLPKTEIGDRKSLQMGQFLLKN